MQIKDMTGVSLGGVVGIRYLRQVNEKALWLWRCHCGKDFERTGIAVRNAAKRFRRTSCGCEWISACSRNGLKRKTHGLSKMKLYDVHRQMLRRCFDPLCKDFKGYGGRGIVVCDEWRSLELFIAWATGSGYLDGLTLERVDFDGNYEPANCKWIPNERQAKNTRRCKFLTFNGKTLTMSDWARETGIKVTTIVARVNRGWSVERILTVRPIPLRTYDTTTIPTNLSR